MEPTQPNEALTRAISKYPSLKAFAGELGVPYQTVQQWMKNGVPAEFCPRIEEMTNGMTLCEDLNSRVNWTYLRATQKQHAPRRSTDPDPPPGRAGRNSVSHGQMMTVATDQPMTHERVEAESVEAKPRKPTRRPLAPP